MFAESRCLRMSNGGLVCCSMCLGVPFIAPRQLGAVGSPFSRQFLPSVGWCTGQCDAPSDMNSARFVSFSGEADRWALGSLGTPDTVWRTPDSPVRPGDRWLGHVSAVDRAANRWRGCYWLTGQSSATPDSSVNFSHDTLVDSREQRVLCWTSLCTGHCPVHQRLVQVWFLALRGIY
jgi:hypothetical protein